ncbi:MAG TPA: amino acid dehydrogenase [Flavobacteriaceae bacterium]|nr:amino acid dehydrogenase [Flavobacteriaceae bacterium]HAT64200.1 amino acid dehydrogenase [Flavobacteriaceae bacterium]|tara:strand:+ start:182719 stop:183966 length:1248 start_codon:yes stop_codon:yes gene_type:complete
MSKKVVVIGGGIIGLCSAYYLSKEGCEVTVIDQSSMDYGASYVNAGYLTPSHIIPLAAPGAMKQGIKWMFNPASPLFIKPRLDASFLQWVWAFNKSCSVKNVNNSIKAIKDINLLSVDLFSELKADEKFNFQLEHKGLLMLCQSEKVLNHEVEVAYLAAKEGLDVTVLNASEVEKLQPNAQILSVGAVHYKCDWHTTPNVFMNEMKAHLENKGVTFFKNEKVEDLQFSEGRIKEIKTQNQSITADEFVLAAGSWSQLLSKKSGIKIPLEAGKGYRINTERETGITIPAILTEARVAVTPMDGFTRFAGTMEIAGIHHKINPVRVEAIAKAAEKYYVNVSINEEEKAHAACGLRPVSPDGKPYIGKSSKCDNLTIATGHAMMGWSMGPATGKLVSEVILDKKRSMNLDAFHPDRKF